MFAAHADARPLIHRPCSSCCGAAVLILASKAAAFSLPLLAAPAMAQNYYYAVPTNPNAQVSPFLSTNKLLAPQYAADAHRNAQLQAELLRQQIELNRLRLQQQQLRLQQQQQQQQLNRLRLQQQQQR